MRQTHRSLLSQVLSMCALMSSHGNVGTVVHRSTMLPSRILHVGPLYQLPTVRCRLRLWARPRPRRALADFRELHASSLAPPLFLGCCVSSCLPPSSWPLLAGRMFAVAMFAAPVSSLGCPRHCVSVFAPSLLGGRVPADLSELCTMCSSCYCPLAPCPLSSRTPPCAHCTVDEVKVSVRCAWPTRQLVGSRFYCQ